MDKPYYVQKKEYGKPPAFGFASKNASIAAAQSRKEAGIKRHTDLKSVSIAVSSAFNSTTDLVNNLVALGVIKVVTPDGKRSLEEYWKSHEAIYAQMLERFTDAQSDAKKDFLTESSGVVMGAAKRGDLFREKDDFAKVDEVNPETGDASI